ncbi:MAG TPA: amidohydrolase family protein [Beijerinckiaceae bacterium]|nr:amidohydrolase family protein [Beijerinckiaceae bacterium]
MSYQRPRSEDKRPRGEWRRDTRPPVPAPPPNSCDCQFHIFGDAGKYPLRNDPALGPPNASFADMQQVLRILGFGRGVIVHSQRYDTDHRLLIDALESLTPQERKNFRATCIVKDDVTDSEMQTLDSLGICAARFNLGKRWIDADDRAMVRRSMERAREIGWHARLHIAGSDIAEWGDFLLSVRDMPMVIDHMAHLDFSLGLQQPALLWIRERLKNDGNWWVKLSNGNRDSAMDFGWDDAIPFARAFIEAAPDRMIWGTDWPHTGWRDRPMMNDADLVELLYRYVDHDKALVQAILVDNPARLHKFD